MNVAAEIAADERAERARDAYWAAVDEDAERHAEPEPLYVTPATEQMGLFQ